MTVTHDPLAARPSTWFTWHEQFIRPGSRVIDLACGDGRHSIAAAQRGAIVTAIDRDKSLLDQGRRRAGDLGLEIEWKDADLEGPWPELGQFDAVLLFNYLDRDRMQLVRDLVAPGGVLIAETFLITQRKFGWGPGKDEHLLRAGEIASLVKPLEIVHGREVLEPVNGDRWRAVASIVAVRSE